MTEPEAVLLSERRSNVLVLTLNRPDARNALSPELLGELGAALRAAEEDVEVRCVVLTGSGDRVFCAGMDLKSFSSGEEWSPAAVEGVKVFSRFCKESVSVPVVGAANGTAAGGGFEILLGCDLVVAAEGARFGLPEVKRGLYAAGGGFVLGTRIPLPVALELALTGELIEADRALALGMVNQVVPPDQLLDAALSLADKIAANGPLAVAATKRLVRTAVSNVDASWELHQELQPQIFGSDDAKEGAAAFIEKRSPDWTGA